MKQSPRREASQIEDIYAEMLYADTSREIIEEADLSTTQIMAAIPVVLNALASLVVSEPTVKQKLLRAVKSGRKSPAPAAVGSGEEVQPAPPAPPPAPIDY